MKLSDRFIDYATTGAFFFIGQLLLFIILIMPWNPSGLMHRFMWSSFPQVPAWLQTPLNGLLATLGIISIFFFGLVLDLFGSLLRAWEMKRFYSLLERNKDWLCCLASKEDYVLSGMKDFLGVRLEDWDNPFVWNINGRELIKDALPILKTSEQHQKSNDGYSRLRYYLNSFILLNSSGTTFDEVTDQTHLWRTSRAICFATVFVMCEAVIGLFITLCACVFHIPFLSSFASTTGLLIFVLSWLGLLIFSYITHRMALARYSWMYENIFSLAYLTYKKVQA